MTEPTDVVDRYMVGGAYQYKGKKTYWSWLVTTAIDEGVNISYLVLDDIGGGECLIGDEMQGVLSNLPGVDFEWIQEEGDGMQRYRVTERGGG